MSDSMVRRWSGQFTEDRLIKRFFGRKKHFHNDGEGGGCDTGDWIDLAQHKIQWRTLYSRSDFMAPDVGGRHL